MGTHRKIYLTATVPTDLSRLARSRSDLSVVVQSSHPVCSTSGSAYLPQPALIGRFLTMTPKASPAADAVKTKKLSRKSATGIPSAEKIPFECRRANLGETLSALDDEQCGNLLPQGHLIAGIGPEHHQGSGQRIGTHG